MHWLCFLQVADLDLHPITSCEQYPVVLHGTYYKFWESIRCQVSMLALCIWICEHLDMDVNVSLVKCERNDCLQDAVQLNSFNNSHGIKGQLCALKMTHFVTNWLNNSRVPDQNGVSLRYIMLEIHHSGQELPICMLPCGSAVTRGIHVRQHRHWHSAVLLFKQTSQLFILMEWKSLLSWVCMLRKTWIPLVVNLDIYKYRSDPLQVVVADCSLPGLPRLNRYWLASRSDYDYGLWALAWLLSKPESLQEVWKVPSTHDLKIFTCMLVSSWFVFCKASVQNDSKFCCMSTLETKLFSASLLDEVCWCDVNELTCVPFASAVINNNNNLIQRLYSRFFFYSLLTALRTVSNTYTQVART